MQSVSMNLMLNIPVTESGRYTESQRSKYKSYLDRGLGHSVDLQIFSSVVGEPNDFFLLED